MAIITSGYVDNAIGTATRLAIAPTTAAFVQYEELARKRVRAKVAVAGYTIADDSTDAQVQALVLGQWYLAGLGFRKGLELPPAVAEAIADLRDIETGALPLVDSDPSVNDGIGGVTFSSTDASDSDAYPQYFSVSDLRKWW